MVFKEGNWAVLDEKTRLTKMRVNEKLYCEGKPKPVWRGHLHKYVCLILPFFVVAMWEKSETPTEVLSTISFSIGMLLTYATSYMFHCIDWSPKSEILIYKLDHFMIFINASSVITQYCLLKVRSYRVPIILLSWFVSLIGGVLIIRKQKETIHNGMSALVLLLVIPDAWRYMSSYQLCLFLATWFQIFVGLLIFARKSPDPWPHQFGYHELMHLFTSTAAVTGMLLQYDLLVQFDQDQCILSDYEDILSKYGFKI